MNSIDILLEVIDTNTGDRNKFYLDLEDVPNIEMNFSIADIKDIGSRSSSYTMPISFPATSHNRMVFGFISEFTSDGLLYKPNKKSNVFISIDKILVFEGTFQLLRYSSELNGRENFEGICYSVQDDFYSSLRVTENDIKNNPDLYYGREVGSDLLLTDLTELDVLSSTYSIDSITYSWVSDYNFGLYYPLLDYGFKMSDSLVEENSSFNAITIGATYSEDSFKAFQYNIGLSYSNPYLFVSWGVNNAIKGDMLRIFNTPSYNGIYTITEAKRVSRDNETPLYRYRLLETLSNGTATATLKLLYNRGFVHPNQFLPAVYIYNILKAIQYRTGFTFVGDFIESDYFKRLALLYTNGVLKTKTRNVLDAVSSFGTSYYIKNPPDHTYIKFSSFTNRGPFVETPYDIIEEFPIYDKSNYYLYKGPNSTFTYNIDLNFIVKDVYYDSLLTIVFFKKTADGTLILVDGLNPPLYSEGLDVNIPFSGNMTGSIDLNDGDSFAVYLYATGNVGYLDNIFQLTALQMTMKLVSGQLLDIPVQLGDKPNLSLLLPNNVTVKSFLINLYKMFNLYVEPVVGFNKILKVEPRDTFYRSGEILNWEDKLEENQKISTKFLADETNYRLLNFTTNTGTDYYNSQYFDKVNRVYGDKKLYIDNDFTTETKNITVNFDPCPLISIVGTYRFPVPHIVSNLGQYVNNFGDFRNVANSKGSSAIRVVEVGGLLPLERDVWRFGTQSWTAATMSSYPYAGNYDNPFQPTRILNFDQPIYEAYGIQFLVNKTLFNDFYKIMIDELIDPSTKFIECQVYLNPDEISNFTFANIVKMRINGTIHYFRVNSIDGYNIRNNGLSTVSLIKIKDIKIIKPVEPILIPPVFGNFPGAFQIISSVVDSPVVGKTTLVIISNIASPAPNSYRLRINNITDNIIEFREQLANHPSTPVFTVIVDNGKNYSFNIKSIYTEGESRWSPRILYP